MDPSLPDPNPLAAEVAAEGEAVDPVGLCDPLGGVVLGGGYDGPFLSVGIIPLYYPSLSREG